MVVMVGSDMMGELWVMVGCGGGMGFVFGVLNDKYLTFDTLNESTLRLEYIQRNQADRQRSFA